MTLAQLPSLLVSLGIISLCLWAVQITLRDHRARTSPPAAPIKPKTPSVVASERDDANGAQGR
ncbi:MULTISPECIES: hypothetical protein [unclassified Sphingomonas]|uniref:hypothetical protein n=1 Tax=unclassified Sphingomonas TaxID=196159 RepID=UPI0006F3E069|nr:MULTISPECIES: hypothetical protein [unclassified Sphingomonas]KQX18383.1 hypothetical protein ASD17_14575 [Sphingomonas sp. Root1294]KQY72292.1 hypothetical protein ASD39_20400 [Sphingomonas sp. Root50]KRB94437.1 hypothetical protein ASE22_00350 [Sphingomonas sp. Root720]